MKEYMFVTVSVAVYIDCNLSDESDDGTPSPAFQSAMDKVELALADKATFPSVFVREGSPVYQDDGTSSIEAN